MYELTHALPMRQVASRPHGSIYAVAFWGIGVPQLAHSAPLACVVTVPRSPDLCPNAHKGQQPFTWLPSRPTSWIVAPYGGLSGFSLAVVVAFFEGAHGRIEWFVRVVQRACQVDGPGCGYALALLVSTVINLLAALVLSGFACFHIGMILKNRSSLKLRDARYDVGYLGNWQQVFGRSMWLWALPLEGNPPLDGGYHWPLNSSVGARSFTRGGGRYLRPTQRGVGERSAMEQKAQ